MSNDSIYITGGNSLLSVPSSVLVVVQGAVELIKNGEVVASIDAKYDFTDVPVEYQSLIVASIGRGKQVHLTI